MAIAVCFRLFQPQISKVYSPKQFLFIKFKHIARCYSIPIIINPKA